jgi:NTE family protein
MRQIVHSLLFIALLGLSAVELEAQQESVLTDTNPGDSTVRSAAADSVLAAAFATTMRVPVPMHGSAHSHGDLTLQSPWRPRLGLVLSGGGARGLAQIGVLRALEEAGIRPDFIVGTSIGSVVGGLYAAGYNARRLEKAVHGIDWSYAMRLSNEADRRLLPVDQKPLSDYSILTLRFDGLLPVLPQSVSNGQRLTNLLNELTLQGLYHSTDFDSLGIPFRAVATDLHSGRSIVLGKGSLAECLRASSTLPVMYSAVARDSMLLVDGGLRANIPVSVAVDAGCDMIVAVNTTSPYRDAEELTNALQIIDQVFNVVMIPQNEGQLAQAHMVITPELNGIDGTDFMKVDSLIALGYAAGRAAARELRDRLFAAAASRMPRPVAQLQRYQMRPGPAYHLEDPWFTDTHSLDEVYRKAVQLSHDGRYAHVEVVLDEDGSAEISTEPALVIKAIEVLGSTLITESAIAGLEGRWIGQPITPDLEREIAEYILEDYRDRGYSLVRVDSVFIGAPGLVRLWIHEGVVDEITVSGNARTNPVVILREIPISAGDIFRMSEMKRGMGNLLALDLFHHVAYDIEENGNGTRMVIRVVERASQELKAGVLIDNERNAQIGLLLRDANFLGSGTEVSASFFSGMSNREYGLDYRTNRLFYTPFSAHLSGYYGFRDYNNFEDVTGLSPRRFAREVTYMYRRIALGTAASIGLDVARFGTLRGTLRYEKQTIRTSEIRRVYAEPISEEHTLVELGLSSTIDTQDRYPYPRQGILLEAEYTSAQTALGSGVAFTRLTLGYEFFVPMIPDILVVHPRFLFGYGDKTMPRTEEFHLGGLYSFVGMRENEYNGRQIALFSAEIRYTLPLQLVYDTYVSLRYDLGRTWENPELIKLEDLRHGIGLQIGLDTPIGPADFGFGHSFYFLRENAETPVRFGPLNLYFSIGTRL